MLTVMVSASFAMTYATVMMCRHMVASDAQRKARFDKRRPPAGHRGYDKEWE